MVEMRHLIGVSILLVFSPFIFSFLIVSVKNEFVMVGTYFAIHCRYNESLERKVFYVFLSWDKDNAVAYLFRGRLVQNERTKLFQKVIQEGFNVTGNAKQRLLSLTITRIQLSYQNLTVICLVKDDDGRGAVLWKKITELRVIDPPHILRFKNHSYNVTRGQSRRVALLCTAAGYPEPLVRWWRGDFNKLIQPQNFDPSTLTARYYLSTPFTSSQEGRYLCEAIVSHRYMQAIGLHSTHKSVQVNVFYAPEISFKLRTIFTEIGQSVTVVIPISANPQPQLVCSFLTIQKPSYALFRGHPSPHRFVFEALLPWVHWAHLGDYPCRAKNVAGEASAMIRIRMGPTRPVILSSASSVFSNHYSLRWSTLSGAPLLNATVKLSYRTGASFLLHQRSISLKVGAPFSDTRLPNHTFLTPLDSLLPGTSYALRLSACNKHHCSPFSRQLRFRTPQFNDKNVIGPVGYPRSAVYTTPSSANSRQMKSCHISSGFKGYSCSASASTHHILLVLLFFLYYLTT